MDRNLKYFLLFVIGVSIFLRFYHLDTLMYGDEIIETVAALKLHHQNWTSGVNFAYDHPPLAKWFAGLASKPEASYDHLQSLLDDPPTYTFIYLARDPIKENYERLRVVSAIAGTILIAFIYLAGRKIFGGDAGLWAAVLASISADLILFSRIVMKDIYLLLFSVITLYFYSEYISSAGRKKYIFMALTAFFFFLTLGTRTLQPLFLVPVIIFGQVAYKRSKKFLKENIFLWALILLSLVAMFGFIYAPKIGFFEKFGAKSFLDLLGFSFDRFTIGLLVRNSYLHLISLGLILYMFVGFVKKSPVSFANKILENRALFIFVLFFIVSYFALGFSRAGDARLNPFSDVIDYNGRYAFVLYPTIFILGGFALGRKFKGIFSAVVIFSILAGFAHLASVYPTHLHYYSNFGVRGYEILGWSYVEEAGKTISFLKGVGNPDVMTNEVNILTFYKFYLNGNYTEPAGLVVHGDPETPEMGDPRCRLDIFEGLAQIKPYIVYRKTESSMENIIHDPRFCGFLQSLNMTEVARFGEVIIYRVNDILPEWKMLKK